VLLDVAAGGRPIYGTLTQAGDRSPLADVTGPGYPRDAVDFWRSRAFSQFRTTEPGVRGPSRPGSCV